MTGEPTPNNLANGPAGKLVYTVSRLNTEVRQVLEGSFPLVWVEGEISTLRSPSSGHLYFALKDAHAQTRCAMFRSRRNLLRFAPAEGMQVLARARITLYEARGDYQLSVEHMEPAGEGRLRQAIEQLKQKLQTEGLFDPAQKQELPALPATIGVVTSPTGAAITDILNVLGRRFPAIRVIVYPVPVQGDNAAAQIVRMLKIAEQRNECELLILARGGGSLEDLMPFNDEQLARTIHALNIPLISAVGHEIDTSISDFVADRRAPTPSAAAELASPDQAHLQQQLKRLAQRLQQNQQLQHRHRQQRFDHLQQRLAMQSPARNLENRYQLLDNLAHRLHRQLETGIQQRHQQLTLIRQRLSGSAPANRLALTNSRLQGLRIRLRQASPSGLIGQHHEQLRQLEQRATAITKLTLGQSGERLAALIRMLDSVSPLATLARGYTITRDEQGQLVRSSHQVDAGDKVTTQLAEGSLLCRVEDVKH